MAKKTASYNLSEEIIDFVDKKAEQEKRSKSQIVEIILQSAKDNQTEIRGSVP